MTEKYLRRKGGAIIKWGEYVTTINGKSYEVRGWTEPTDQSPLGWVRLFDRHALHDQTKDVYPTAINAHFA